MASAAISRDVFVSTVLPSDWSAHQSRQHPSLVYYFNKRTGETRWDAPSIDEEEPNTPPLPPVEVSAMPARAGSDTFCLDEGQASMSSVGPASQAIPSVWALTRSMGRELGEWPESSRHDTGSRWSENRGNSPFSDRDAREVPYSASSRQCSEGPSRRSTATGTSRRSRSGDFEPIGGRERSLSRSRTHISTATQNRRRSSRDEWAGPSREDHRSPGLQAMVKRWMQTEQENDFGERRSRMPDTESSARWAENDWHSHRSSSPFSLNPSFVTWPNNVKIGKIYRWPRRASLNNDRGDRTGRRSDYVVHHGCRGDGEDLELRPPIPQRDFTLASRISQPRPYSRPAIRRSQFGSSFGRRIRSPSRSRHSDQVHQQDFAFRQLWRSADLPDLIKDRHASPIARTPSPSIAYDDGDEPAGVQAGCAHKMEQAGSAVSTAFGSTGQAEMVFRMPGGWQW